MLRLPPDEGGLTWSELRAILDDISAQEAKQRRVDQIRRARGR